jgi:hypothetical protein
VKTAALLVALALASALAACGGPVGHDAATVGGAAWTRAAAGPLSARHAPLLAWTGQEVLVVGGHTGAPCPPNADCPLPDDHARDAAAYDPGSDTWRPIADAPADLDRYVGHVVADGDLVVGGAEAWWRYDAEADAWSRLPGATEMGAPEVAADGVVYTHVGRRVRALDLATGEWRSLPEDPVEPPLTEGAVFATDAGIVLAGVDHGEAAPDEPTLTQADVWDGGSWRRLPRTGMIGPLSHWTGERLIGLELGGADGGEVNGWDRWYPYAGAVDPATGEWSAIDRVPDQDGVGDAAWRVEAAAGPLVATSGFVYDDRAVSWTRLGRPASDLAEELTGVWAAGRLVVVGGADEDGEVSAETWIWTP